MWKLNFIETICQKIIHAWIQNGFVWKSWSRWINFVRTKFQEDAWSVRNYGIWWRSTHPITWQGATKILNVMPSNRNHDCDAFKSGHIGFRYVLFLSMNYPKKSVRFVMEWGIYTNQDWDATLLVRLSSMYTWLYYREGRQVIKLVRHDWTKFLWTVCQIDGLSKHIFKVFIVKQLLLKICKHVWTYGNWWSYLWRCNKTLLKKLK